jgi:hypothetical protein
MSLYIWMHACVIVLYNTPLRVPCSFEIIKCNICVVNLNQFSERKWLLSCMPFAWNNWNGEMLWFIFSISWSTFYEYDILTDHPYSPTIKLAHKQCVDPWFKQVNKFSFIKKYYFKYSSLLLRWIIFSPRT